MAPIVRIVREVSPGAEYVVESSLRFCLVCAVDSLVNKDDDTHMVEQVYPIAGELKDRGGGNLDAKWSRLKASKGHEDSKKEGLSLELNGGFKQTDAGKKQPQMAIIEFLCDKSKTGLEGMPNEKDDYERRKAKREEKTDTPEDDASTPSLTFVSYEESEAVKGTDLLRLTWRTKAACEDAKQKQDAEKGKHWGFFTWFILMYVCHFLDDFDYRLLTSVCSAFLSTAAYLIFGSWLNYNRYGARGWDLLPHGDTIRDVPYLVKDAMRRVVNTVQGGGSRGGYAAV
jgi:hypothetical protein